MTAPKSEKDSAPAVRNSHASPARDGKFGSVYENQPPAAKLAENGVSDAGIPSENELSECHAVICKPELTDRSSAPPQSSASGDTSDESVEPVSDAERADRIIRITDRIVERLSEAVEILRPDDTQHMKQIVSSLSEIIDIRKQSSSEASVITVNFEGDEDYSE